MLSELSTFHIFPLNNFVCAQTTSYGWYKNDITCNKCLLLLQQKKINIAKLK